MDDIIIYGVEISGGVLASMFYRLNCRCSDMQIILRQTFHVGMSSYRFLNIMTVMKLIGRPTWHAWLFFTPAVVYLLPKTIIEIAQSFGKKTTTDYVLALVFNIFYILNLGCIRRGIRWTVVPKKA